MGKKCKALPIFLETGIRLASKVLFWHFLLRVCGACRALSHSFFLKDAASTLNGSLQFACWSLGYFCFCTLRGKVFSKFGAFGKRGMTRWHSSFLVFLGCLPCNTLSLRPFSIRMQRRQPFFSFSAPSSLPATLQLKNVVSRRHPKPLPFFVQSWGLFFWLLMGELANFQFPAGLSTLEFCRQLRLRSILFNR